jgi:hypothetical protein
VEDISEPTKMIIINSIEMIGIDQCMALKLNNKNSWSLFYLIKIRIFLINSNPNLFNFHKTLRTNLFLLTTQISMDKNKTLQLI